MPSRRIVCLATLLACSSFAPIAAQSTALAIAACTYKTCALRVEPVLFGVALVQGSSGERVARLGGFGSGVDLLLSGPDSAAAHARTYVRSTRTTAFLGLGAVVAYATVALRTDSFRGHADDGDIALTVGSVGLAIATIPFAIKAQRALSRAVWWYNAELPR